jgi:uncharacterized protein (TIGR03067 family)
MFDKEADMASLRWLVVVGVACVVGAGIRADTPSDDAKKLEGTWVVTFASFNGKPADNIESLQFTFAGDKLAVQTGKDEGKYTYKVDPAKNPKTMDWALVEKAPNTEPVMLIYALDRDVLILVLSGPDNRPTEFTDRHQTLIILKRKK